MSYVQHVLQPGEQVRQVSSIHWIIYWPGVAVVLLAVVAYWLSETRLLPGIWRYTAYALALIGGRSLNPGNGSGGGSPRSQSPTGGSSTRKVSSGGRPTR